MSAQPASDRPAPNAATPPATSGALLRLSGADALSLVHRLSTQSVDDLAPGETRMTMCCDFRGRVLHRFAVARTADGGVWLARDDGAAAELVAYLDRFVFRDDVRFDDALHGGAVRLSFDHGVARAGAVEERDGVPARLQVETEAALIIVGRDAGADAAGDAAASELARIRAAWPRHNHEAESSFTPYEIGRAHEVHLSKGCYTGQEALLRMVTYGGVRRALVGLVGAGPVPAAPSDLLSDDARVGRLTSTARDGAGWIGLAVLKTDTLDAVPRVDGHPETTITCVTRAPVTRPAGMP